MKEFDIELARQGKRVCTRDGREVEIFKFDARNPFPIFGVATGKDEDYFMRWNLDGKYLPRQGNNDLMMVAEKHEGWLNLFIDEEDGEDKEYAPVGVYDTREEALKHTSNEGSWRYIATVKIEWEE